MAGGSRCARPGRERERTALHVDCLSGSRVMVKIFNSWLNGALANQGEDLGVPGEGLKHWVGPVS